MNESMLLEESKRAKLRGMLQSDSMIYWLNLPMRFIFMGKEYSPKEGEDKGCSHENPNL